MIERKVLAACLAHVNMGYPEPSVFDIANAVVFGKHSVELCVNTIFRARISTARDEEKFISEAESFLDMMEGKDDVQLFKTWPTRSKLIHQCKTDINID